MCVCAQKSPASLKRRVSEQATELNRLARMTSTEMSSASASKVTPDPGCFAVPLFVTELLSLNQSLVHLCLQSLLLLVHLGKLSSHVVKGSRDDSAGAVTADGTSQGVAGLEGHLGLNLTLETRVLYVKVSAQYVQGWENLDSF